MTAQTTKSRSEVLTERTIKIIKRYGTIYLRRQASSLDTNTYLHLWTNIAAGPDEAVWTVGTRNAMEIFNLEWAFAIAPLYKCKVVVRYPKKKS